MQTTLLFLNMGGYEILLIILVILIFFGAKKIPELARGMGRGIREFKDATREITDELDDSVNGKPKANTKPNTNASVSGNDAVKVSATDDAVKAGTTETTTNKD